MIVWRLFTAIDCRGLLRFSDVGDDYLAVNCEVGWSRLSIRLILLVMDELLEPTELVPISSALFPNVEDRA